MALGNISGCGRLLDHTKNSNDLLDLLLRNDEQDNVHGVYTPCGVIEYGNLNITNAINTFKNNYNFTTIHSTTIKVHVAQEMQFEVMGDATNIILSLDSAFNNLLRSHIHLNGMVILSSCFAAEMHDESLLLSSLELSICCRRDSKSFSRCCC
ncbi:hypothetical protein H5410_057798 [Solanum commersonii]|uniref:Uncharacterized protein n=1 Tax=Solanum commersonii TaxID=4109 RepID=A0A9J5WRM6_SOLCO|nr:hypothetical protein H5410_057798 [Solanum commersonii]